VVEGEKLVKKKLCQVGVGLMFFIKNSSGTQYSIFVSFCLSMIF